MAISHWILQGKGGVGKSNIASLLTQYLLGQGVSVSGYDTDPVNATFAGYKGFHVRRVRFFDGQQLNQRLLDPFVEELLTLPADTHAVIDNGAATFLPLCSYMAENPVLPMLQSQGTVFMHTVITGGQSMGDTVSGLESLAKTFPSTNIVVWLNSYYGEITSNGKTFEEFEVYQTYKQNIHALVRIPNMNRDTFGKDIETLLSRRQTFDEALNDAEWNIMARERLKIFRGMMASELDNARLFTE